MVRPGSSFDIPSLNYFTSKNIFTGSLRGMGYIITPQEGQLHGAVWHGNLRSDLSEMVSQVDFPLEEAGLASLLDWLEQQFRTFLLTKE